MSITIEMVTLNNLICTTTKKKVKFSTFEFNKNFDVCIEISL